MSPNYKSALLEQSLISSTFTSMTDESLHEIYSTVLYANSSHIHVVHEHRRLLLAKQMEFMFILYE
jgi:hypothetical protein